MQLFLDISWGNPRMDTSYFEADKDLIELAKRTCDEVNPDIHSYVGRVVSGISLFQIMRRNII